MVQNLQRLIFKVRMGSEGYLPEPRACVWCGGSIPCIASLGVAVVALMALAMAVLALVAKVALMAVPSSIPTTVHLQIN